MIALSDMLSEFRAAIDDDNPQHYCDVCGAPVAHMRERCVGCRELMVRQDRRLHLSCAYSSLPAMPWAEFGSGFESKCNRDVLSAAGEWTRSKGNLMLLGPSGCGKTSAVVARLRSILSHALQGVDRPSFNFASGIRFYSASDLVRAKSRWPLGEGEPPEIEEATNASLLVLDEIGYEPQTNDAVPDVAHARYTAGRVTISTSGQTREGLIERYGDATVRKLVSTGTIVEAFEVTR